MKRLKVVTLAVGLALGAGSAQAALINGGFETGDLTGWTVGTLTGAGTATVVMSNTTTYSPGDWGDPHTFFPNEGTFFLAIQSGAEGDWQEVTQAVALAAGQAIGGHARFDWGDYWTGGTTFPDGAKVEIRDGAGGVVATPFYDDGTLHCLVPCDPATDQAGAESPWTAWGFTALLADTYTVVYAARNTGDGGGPNQTFGYFDGAQVVPEPGALALLGLGLLGLGAFRRKQI